MPLRACAPLLPCTTAAVHVCAWRGGQIGGRAARCAADAALRVAGLAGEMVACAAEYVAKQREGLRAQAAICASLALAAMMVRDVQWVTAAIGWATAGRGTRVGPAAALTTAAALRGDEAAAEAATAAGEAGTTTAAAAGSARAHAAKKLAGSAGRTVGGPGPVLGFPGRPPGVPGRGVPGRPPGPGAVARMAGGVRRGRRRRTGLMTAARVITAQPAAKTQTTGPAL